MANESDAEVPKVSSVSYGGSEATVTMAVATRLNTDIEKLGLRGISVLYASGDSGASCAASGNAFAPDFPAELPFVTGVGGASQVGGTWQADSIAGGGFSNKFPQQPWQASAVAAYLKAAKANGYLPSSYFNASGRAYPDIAAVSEDVIVVTDLLPEPVGGTSCAAPTVGAVIGLLNNERLKAGKKTLGFLNPLIYAAGSGSFHPLRKGCNKGCSQKGMGFCASGAAWSPTTGLGFPNFEALKTLALSLP